MEGRLLARARAKQEQLRAANRAEENSRRAEIYARIPEIAGIDAQLRRHMTELVGLAIGRQGRSAEELRQDNLTLQARKKELLRAAGYPEDYLAPVVSCPRCRDTGSVDGKVCECLLKFYKQEQTAELSPLLGDGEQCFDNFRLSWYSDVPAGENQRSPRSEMRTVYDLCRNYAANFSPAMPNMLFTGAPGLGKTFLSACIAREVAEKGFSVAYDTASGLLSVFEREKFSRDEDERAEASSRVRQLLGCDLLILDDLGTEMLNAFTQSALYTLLDGRLRGEEKKKTIISTNLARDAIAERYGAQLASRLQGEYLWLTFTGRDIRQLRKESL